MNSTLTHLCSHCILCSSPLFTSGQNILSVSHLQYSRAFASAFFTTHHSSASFYASRFTSCLAPIAIVSTICHTYYSSVPDLSVTGYAFESCIFANITFASGATLLFSDPDSNFSVATSTFYRCYSTNSVTTNYAQSGGITVLNGYAYSDRSLCFDDCYCSFTSTVNVRGHDHNIQYTQHNSTLVSNIGVGTQIGGVYGFITSSKVTTALSNVNLTNCRHTTSGFDSLHFDTNIGNDLHFKFVSSSSIVGIAPYGTTMASYTHHASYFDCFNCTGQTSVVRNWKEGTLICSNWVLYANDPTIFASHSAISIYLTDFVTDVPYSYNTIVAGSPIVNPSITLQLHSLCDPHICGLIPQTKVFTSERLLPRLSVALIPLIVIGVSQAY